MGALGVWLVFPWDAGLDVVFFAVLEDFHGADIDDTVVDWYLVHLDLSPFVVTLVNF